MTKKLFIITGEHSGDTHAAAVVKQIKDLNTNIEIEAIGGVGLRELGVKLFVDHSKMSAVGLTPKILLDHIFLGKRVVDYLKKEYKPDLVLLIDYGVFNLNISKFLKKQGKQGKVGIKVYYYIPPQIWASRKWRINTVKKNIDKVMTIFPFEKSMYEKEGIEAEFVGHPLVSQLPPEADKDEFFEKYGLDKNKKLVSIFPGSRSFELKNLMPVFLKAAQIIKSKNNNVQFIISQAPNIKDETFEASLRGGHKPDAAIQKNTTGLLRHFVPCNDETSYIPVIKGDNHSLLSTSDALILASGTVALEAALYQTPMIISYKGPWLYYFAYRLVRCIKRVCLPNIIMDKDIVPELLQSNSKPEIIAENILKLINDESARNAMIADLSKVKEILSSKDSSTEVANIIVQALR